MTLTKPSEFISHLYKLDDDDDIDNMLDFVYEFMDDNFTAGNFELCNQILEQVDVKKLSIHAHLALLTTSSWAKSKLPYRETLYQSIYAELQEFMSVEKINRLLTGLD